VSRRRLLRVSVKLAVLAAMAVFSAVLVQGMLGPRAPASDVVAVGDIPEGSARLVSWRGRAVWIVHRSPAQLAALGRSRGAGTVAEQGPAGPYRSATPEYGMFFAGTGRPGILLQYTRQRPDSLSPDRPWHGGFVDPASGAVFDLAGRRYRASTGEPLAFPPHRPAGDAAFILGQW